MRDRDRCLSSWKLKVSKTSSSQRYKQANVAAIWRDRVRSVEKLFCVECRHGCSLLIFEWAILWLKEITDPDTILILVVAVAVYDPRWL